MGTQITKPPKLPPVWFKHLFWRGHRILYRLRGGRVLWTPSAKRGWGAMHLTTVGRRSGQQRGVIVGYIEDGATPAVLAMNGWDEGQPAWWLNLDAHPDAVIRLKGQPERRCAPAEWRARSVIDCGSCGPRSMRGSTRYAGLALRRHARDRLRTTGRSHRRDLLTPAPGGAGVTRPRSVQWPRGLGPLRVGDQRDQLEGHLVATAIEQPDVQRVVDPAPVAVHAVVALGPVEREAHPNGRRVDSGERLGPPGAGIDDVAATRPWL